MWWCVSREASLFSNSRETFLKGEKSTRGFFPSSSLKFRDSKRTKSNAFYLFLNGQSYGFEQRGLFFFVLLRSVDGCCLSTKETRKEKRG